MELTNNLRKTYASLAQPKGRRESGLFMAQGTKCVLDTMGHFQLEALLATNNWIEQHPGIAASQVTTRDLERISTLSTPPQVIAIYKIPAPAQLPDFTSELVLALDCVQDPGNLGTIMRVCDWMGVHSILASADTADVWNPKVVQATMGAISRVRVIYTDLGQALEKAKVPIYGTFLDGENIYKADLAAPSVIIMGNEGKGISSAIAELVTHKLTIPSYPPDTPTSESLNVAIATAITLSEFRRNG
ncbi:MAG: RNA methyltransferase [Bacteroidales bacterium]|nr:RNA methyltransferase [Bacteroidales bacterium]